MSIRTKILLACFSLTVITLGFGAVTWSAQAQLGQIATRLYDDAFMSMSYLRAAQNMLLSVSRDVASGSPDAEKVGLRLDEAVGDINVAVERALSDKGRVAASELRDRLSRMSAEFESEQRLPGRQVLAELEAKFDRAVELNAGDGFRSRRATRELIARISLQTWLAMGLSVALALAITYILSRAIVPALRNAVGIASAIAGGKLDNQIVTRGKSETAALLVALDTMQSAIADLMARQASTHATEMASQHARFETALDNMVQGLCMFDAGGRMLVHNRRFAEMFAAASQGTPASLAVPAPLRWDEHTRSWSEPRSFTRTLDDERVIAVTEAPMAEGGWVATYEDVTERHRVEARIAHIARHDSLTGLPNRIFYREYMAQALARARRGMFVAVLYLDLDNFKVINDTLGHSLGDRLLCAVSQRLQHEIRETDRVLRLGGDEFVIVQTTDRQAVGAKSLAERLERALSEPFALVGQTLTISSSIGISVSEDGMTDADALLKCAELALYRAKSEGRGTYRFFEAEMDAEMQARRALELDLRTAVNERQFENYYQPLVNVQTQLVEGFEALVRWSHPVRGMVPPSEFIPIAEETGLIAQIGMQVLERACRDALAWPDHVNIAVNLSPLQFRNKGLAAEIGRALERSGLRPARLELEITESLLLQDGDGTLIVLEDMRALGVRISMDDFGTGYSSLGYLQRFPFDKIKIDQSFVRRLSEGSVAIVRVVLGLGRALGMRVVAEGVETVEQFEILRAEGCEQVQGYLFSRPCPAASTADLLQGRLRWQPNRSAA